MDAATRCLVLPLLTWPLFPSAAYLAAVAATGKRKSVFPAFTGLFSSQSMKVLVSANIILLCCISKTRIGLLHIIEKKFSRTVKKNHIYKDKQKLQAKSSTGKTMQYALKKLSPLISNTTF